MPFSIIRNDITKMRVDAIVNAANTNLQMGGGVCGAIFRAAGKHKLQKAFDRLAPIKTGDAVITSGFALTAKYIIHTAGPVYNPQDIELSELLLSSAYTNSIKCAQEHSCKSVAFPLISSGAFGYPVRDAMRVARQAIRSFLEAIEDELDVYLVILDNTALSIDWEGQESLNAYITQSHTKSLFQPVSSFLDMYQKATYDESVEASHQFRVLTNRTAQKLDTMVDHPAEPFTQMLLHLIDESGRTDVEIYKNANIDRKLFSKIRSNPHYVPSKKTAIALAVALRLSYEQTQALLKCAGFALSASLKADIIVSTFIYKEIYDIYEINEVLFLYGQPLLGN